MLHLMILTILLLTISAILAMRRIEDDIIKRYAIDRRQGTPIAEDKSGARSYPPE